MKGFVSIEIVFAALLFVVALVYTAEAVGKEVEMAKDYTRNIVCYYLRDVNHYIVSMGFVAERNLWGIDIVRGEIEGVGVCT